MNVSITGSTGCLGQPLIKKLLWDGFNIKVLVLPQDRVSDWFKNNVQIVAGSLASIHDLKYLTKDSEIVFHLAAKVHSVPKTKAEKQEFYAVNIDGTKKLLKASKENGVKRVVFYSTVGVYGQDKDFHGDECSPCRPVTLYAKNKYMAEQLVLKSSNDGGPEGVVLRFPVVYGPLDRGNVAKLIKAIYQKLFLYFGDGNCLRSMISSKNAAEAAVRAAFEPKAVNEVFCVTDGQDYSMNELVDSICCALGTKWRPYHVPVSAAKMLGKVGDLLEKVMPFSLPINSDRVRKLSQPLTFSCEKAKKVFGYEPVETLGEGIRRELEWLYPQIREQ